MKSPFPGMDPYIEKYWTEVHTGLITYARDQIQARLPADLYARMEARVILEAPAEDEHSYYPDVHVVEPSRSSRPRRAIAGAGALAVAEPFIVKTSEEPRPQRYIAIRDGSLGGRVVTVIEFVSPSNKMPGSSRSAYLEKRDECLEGGASVVEIDLTRAGKRSLNAPLTLIPRSKRAEYMACVTRARRMDQFELYPLALRERLPGIRIPLRETDSDAILDLQALLDQAYSNGRYRHPATYAEDLDPPLSSIDAKWADELLRAAKLRE